MHEYGMPSGVYGEYDGIIHEHPYEEHKMTNSNFSSSNFINKNPFIQFDPVEYGAIDSKYVGD